MLKENKKTSNKFLLRLGAFFAKKEKEVVFENLAMLIGAGLEVSLALQAISKEIRNKQLKTIILEIREDILMGSTLWQAFEKSSLFPEYVISLIRVGEESGQLKEKLQIVAEQQKKSRMLKSQIKSALSYPILIIILTFVVGLGVSWFILPRFVSIFKLMNQDLPMLTQGLVSGGEFFANYGYIFVPSLMIFTIFLVYFLFFFRKTKKIGQWILVHLPITKRLVQEIEVSRFGYNLGTFLQAGLTLKTSLIALSGITGMNIYKKFYAYLGNQTTDGQSFAECFESFPNSKKLVPISIQQIIISGEQSGYLAKSLVDVGLIYEAKTEMTAKSMTTLLEPILLIIIGLGVLGVALAIITPIYGLMGSL